MGAKAEVDFSGDGSQILRTMKSIEGGFDAITKQIQRQAAESDKNNKETQAFFDKWSTGSKSVLRDAAAIVSGIVSVRGAVALATAEYDKMIQKSRQAADAGKYHAAAIAAATRNAPTGVTGGVIDDLSKSAAQRAGLTPTQIANAMPAMFAAGQDALSPSRYREILEQSGPIAYGSDAEYQATTVAAASLLAKAGPKANISTKQAIGFVQQAGAASAIPDFATYGPLAGGVFATADAKGFDGAELVGVFNAFTRATSDDKGASSRTATIQYASALRAAAVAMGMPNERSPAKIVAALRDPKNSAGRRAFEKELKGEQSHIDIMRSSALDAGSGGARYLDEGFARTPSLDTAANNYDATVRNIRSSPTVAALLPSEALNVATAKQRLDPREIAIGANERALDEFFGTQKTSALGDKFTMASYRAAVMMGADPDEYLIGHLSNRERQLTTPRRWNFPGGMGDAPVDAQVIQPSQEEVTLASQIRELITFLRDEQRSQADDRRAQTVEFIQGIMAAFQQAAANSVSTNGDRPALPFDLFGIGGRTFGILQRAFDPANARPASY